MPSDSATRAKLTEATRAKVWAIIGMECAMAEEDGERCDGAPQVDHPWGRDWVPRKVSCYNRWRRYLKEAEAGMVRCLCRAHNERVRPKAKPISVIENAPF